MTKQIPLTQGKFALVDDEDYEWLSQWKWYAAQCNGNVYAARKPKDGIIYMHRLVSGVLGEKETDHINGNKLDNRRENLRPATHQQNGFNMSIQRRESKTSMFKGVYKYSRPGMKKPWNALICVNGKTMSLGYFSTEEEAAQAYDKASQKYHGEFGKRNFE